MEYFPIILILFLLAVLITRTFTVLFHELGHAIPAILLTKEKVAIYIGSHGDPHKSLHFNIGLLEVWFKYNPFSWKMGLCVPSAKYISINRQIIYTLSGPLASTTIAVVACYFTFAYDFHGSVKLFLIIFLGSSIFDLYANLTPNATPIILHDGTISYNDGYSLKQLLYYKRYPKQYELGVKLFYQQQYAQAGTIFENFIANGLKDENIYRTAIASFLQVKDYEKAKKIIDDFILQDKMTSDDYANAGISYSQLGLHDKALELYDKSLLIDQNNKYSLNNKGYTMNLLGRYEEAIPLFDKAIEIDADFAYSYNNRGLSKIKIKRVSDGLKDINHSFTLDNTNSYYYLNLGIYHFDQGEYEEALKQFIKAKELDPTTYNINTHISETEQLV